MITIYDSNLHIIIFSCHCHDFATQASTISIRDCLEGIQHRISSRKSNQATQNLQQNNEFVGGFEIVGRIVCMGNNVNKSSKHYKIGARVAALLSNGGGYARYASICKDDLIPLPDTASNDDIICIVSSYIMAYQCLKMGKDGGIPLTQSGVLITDAGTSVGQACVDLALREGANVVAISDKMFETHLRNRGVRKWFSIKSNDWLPAVEGKMDVVIDTRGFDDNLESSYKSLSATGLLVCTMNTSLGSNIYDSEYIRKAVELKSWWISTKVKYTWDRVVLYDIFESYKMDPQMFTQEMHYLLRKLELGEITPKVSKRVSFDGVANALTTLEKGTTNGTLVCLPWANSNVHNSTSV